MSELLSNFFQTQGFSDKEASVVAGKFKRSAIARGDFFLREGNVSKHLGFIESGFLQYFIYLNGEEKTTYSSGAHSFVASLTSYLKQIPARENIRAVSDSVVWSISRESQQALVREMPSFATYYLGVIEWQICCIDESRLDGILLSAKERYEKMLEKEPALIQQIPLQYLASILGVTPRHLSRIRSEIR